MIWGRRKNKEPSQDNNLREVLTSGVPEYLAQSLCIWINNAEVDICSTAEAIMSFNPEELLAYNRQQLILAFQEVQKRTVPFSPLNGVKNTGDFFLAHDESRTILIPYVEFLLKKLQSMSAHSMRPVSRNSWTGVPQSQVKYLSEQYPKTVELVEKLEEILETSSSKWKVSTDPDRPGLVERIDPMQQRMVEDAISANDLAARLLSDAYNKIFGREMDYDAGYANLIKAVETLSHPLVSPGTESHSLSKDAQYMYDQKNWHYVIEPTLLKYQVQGGMLRPLMQALMNNHTSRHGNEETYQPTDERKAKAAFYVAVLLVEAFRDGYITRGGTGTDSE